MAMSMYRLLVCLYIDSAASMYRLVVGLYIDSGILSGRLSDALEEGKFWRRRDGLSSCVESGDLV